MKKIISICAVMCLVIAMLSGLSAVADEPVWDGSVATSFAGGNGTASDPYQIANGAQLSYLAKVVNDGTDNGAYRVANYKLTADIVLNTGDAAGWGETAPANVFTPIGIASNGTDDTTWRAGAFNGTFDGNGKTVSGVYVVNEKTNSKNAGTGLFAIVGDKATVKNLVVTNSYISANKAAGVIGLAMTADTLNVSGIYSDITANAVEAGAGGVIGQLSGNGGGKVSGCVFMGTADAVESVGGIIGNGNGKKIVVENCLNVGTITSVDNKFSGGIVGRNDSSDCQITACVSVGVAKYNFVGSNSSSKKPTVKNSYYLGTLDNKNVNIDEACASLDELTSVVGTDLSPDMMGVLTEWTARTNDIIIPKAVSEFAPSTADIYATKYTVQWLNADGTLIMSEEYKMGETPSYKGQTPTKAEDDTYTYTFSKWSPAIAPVMSDTTYTAEFYSTRKNLDMGEDNEAEDNFEPKAPETKAPATDTAAADTAAEKKSGCGSIIGGGAVALVAVLGMGAVSFKKKED